MNKKKYFILLLVQLFILLLGIYSESFCSIDTNTFQNDLLKIENKGGFTSGFTNSIMSSTDFMRGLNDSNYNGYVIAKISTGVSGSIDDNSVLIFLSANNIVNGSGTLSTNWSSFGRFTGYVFNSSGRLYRQGNLQFNLCNFSYAYTTINVNTTSLKLNAGEEFGTNYINKAFKFIPSTQSHIPITRN